MYAETRMLYASATEDDAARVRAYLDSCAYTKVDSDHDIHVAWPDVFVTVLAEPAGRRQRGALSHNQDTYICSKTVFFF